MIKPYKSKALMPDLTNIGNPVTATKHIFNRQPNFPVVFLLKPAETFIKMKVCFKFIYLVEKRKPFRSD